MKITYTVDAIEDAVAAIEYVRQRSPRGAAKIAARLLKRIELLAEVQVDGPAITLRSGATVRASSIPPFKIYYRRLTDELLIVRVHHQARRPIEK